MSDERELIAEREKKVEEIRALGANPYANGFTPTHTAAEIQARFDRVDAGLEELAADHRKTRKVTGSAGWLGTIDGEISGVEQKP